MNCFQISIFAVHEQPKNERKKIKTVVNCFQISIFAVHEQLLLSLHLCSGVVNCFQISIFAVHEQQTPLVLRGQICCELLSN